MYVQGGKKQQQIICLEQIMCCIPARRCCLLTYPDITDMVTIVSPRSLHPNVQHLLLFVFIVHDFSSRLWGYVCFKYLQQIIPPKINPLPSGKGFKAFGLIKILGTKGVLELSIFSRNFSCGREIFLAWSSRNVSDWDLLWNSPAYLKKIEVKPIWFPILFLSLIQHSEEELIPKFKTE